MIVFVFIPVDPFFQRPCFPNRSHMSLCGMSGHKQVKVVGESDRSQVACCNMHSVKPSLLNCST